MHHKTEGLTVQMSKSRRKQSASCFGFMVSVCGIVWARARKSCKGRLLLLAAMITLRTGKVEEGGCSAPRGTSRLGSLFATHALRSSVQMNAEAEVLLHGVGPSAPTTGQGVRV